MPALPLVHEGVPYHLPAKGTAQSLQLTISIDELRRQGIEFIRIQWVDLINNIRYRVVPLEYFEKLLMSSRPGISLTKACLGLVFITIVEGFGATGDYLYALDLSSIRTCPYYAPGHASIMGWFEERTPIAGQVGHRSIEVDLCPRTILKRLVDNAKQTSGVELLVGFETEFILLKSTNPIEAVNSHGWSNSPALASGTIESLVLEEIAKSLRASGIELQMYHAEAAPGQYEVVTGPLPPVQAVDALIHTRETIYNIASKHGLRATLAPRVFLDNTGSGAHAHISVHAPNQEPRPSTHPNLTHLESTFLAGVLDHLAALTLLVLPTTASYQRMMDGVWSGGTYICWGTENREAPVRLCNAHSLSSRNFEFKTLDGTANPYLALAGVLGAGFEGILESKELKIQDCSGGKTAALIGEKGRAELGIKEQFPLTWEDARLEFEKSVFVDSLFGSDFKTKYLSANKVLKEQMTFGLMDDEALKVLVENY